MNAAPNSIRIGTGAGYGGDRIDPAVQLLEKGNLDYIVFECLAERTIAIAQKEKLENPSLGYNHMLLPRMERILPLCRKTGTKVITNMGAANPQSAAVAVKNLARKLGIDNMKIAYVTGDSVFDRIDRYMDHETLELREPLRCLKEQIVSANAYIGSSGIVEALRHGADIVICGRVSDPSLFLGPLIHEFGWSGEDYEIIGKGILAGHLLECGAQVTGGYFADPGYKDVPDLWKVGFPIGEVFSDGTVIIGKLDDAGGIVNRSTCIEQILYEIHDPHSYITPDGIADLSKVSVAEIGENRVKVENASGRAPTGKLKVSIGYKDCFIGESEISYGGPGCLERAKLAAEIVKRRLRFLAVSLDELKIDFIGVNALYGDDLSPKLLNGGESFSEVRLRVAVRTKKRKQAESVGEEVESLYLNGPAGGGGIKVSVREIISVASIFISESDVTVAVNYENT